MKYTGGVDSRQISCAPDRLQTTLQGGFLAPLIENCYGWRITSHSDAPLQAFPCATVLEAVQRQGGFKLVFRENPCATVLEAVQGSGRLPQSVPKKVASGVEGEEGYAGKVYGKGGPEGGVVAQVFCNATAGKDAKAHSYVPAYQEGGVGCSPLGI